MGLDKPSLDLARHLAALRQAAENEVIGVQTGLAKINPPHKLTEFEKSLIRTAFKGGAVFGVAYMLDKTKE